ncbi:hypothetical protein K2173_028144 [Erythroxylum novogranatense]|uniref:Uncharacterized protein n=1 Tax=Erythroxylum novogranatense TaxID=1862640 RepID=A0AAV8U119_9ROSI|nr:hypothetical protein K2173_028144 [Erythroxylum novogranatense]
MVARKIPIGRRKSSFGINYNSDNGFEALKFKLQQKGLVFDAKEEALMLWEFVVQAQTVELVTGNLQCLGIEKAATLFQLDLLWVFVVEVEKLLGLN